MGWERDRGASEELNADCYEKRLKDESKKGTVMRWGNNIRKFCSGRKARQTEVRGILRAVRRIKDGGVHFHVKK